MDERDNGEWVDVFIGFSQLGSVADAALLEGERASPISVPGAVPVGLVDLPFNQGYVYLEERVCSCVVSHAAI